MTSLLEHSNAFCSIDNDDCLQKYTDECGPVTRSVLLWRALVVRGHGPPPGAGHHGAGEAGERAGRVPPGRHALSAGLLPG